MSPTNVALVKLFQADKVMREAQTRLDDASRAVRVQERRVNELNEKLQVAQTQLREQQAKAGELDLEVKVHEEKIERLRQQQQQCKNLKEYQTFLVEINTGKIDKEKIEDALLKIMESVEQTQKQVADFTTMLHAERQKFEQTQAQHAGKLAQLKAEVDALRPQRDQAAAAVPGQALDMFERLNDRYEGEAMAAIDKPRRRSDEYVCTACNMSLVVDIYNRLHVRDEPVICPNCRRMLYIPADLPPELALNNKASRKPKAAAPAEEQPAT